jgi:hypothetical protein
MTSGTILIAIRLLSHKSNGQKHRTFQPARPHGGARGSGGPKGARNGNYNHGRYTAEAIARRQWLRETIREVRALTRMLRDRR